MEVKVCFRGADTPQARQSLRERLQAQAKVSPVITAATEHEIHLLQNPEGNRKRRVFLDLRDEGGG